MTELEKAAKECTPYESGQDDFIAGATWAFQNRDVEKVLCAACYFPDGQQYPHQPRNVMNGFVTSGWRHHNCISLSGVVLEHVNRETFLIYRNMEVQGFLTSKGNFVDRREAAVIAYSAGQIPEPKQELYSEDLY